MIEGAPREPERSTDGMPVWQVMLDDKWRPPPSLPPPPPKPERPPEPEKRCISERMKAYGMPPSKYHELLAEQGGGCRLCGRKPDRRPLVIDHDHVTGVVRALLCHRCNCGLGFFGDDPARLREAAAYLESFQK